MNFLQLHFVTNSGAAFSLASGFTWILSIVALGVIGFIIWFARRIRSVAWAIIFGLVLGGALGNVTDRLFREPGFGVGHVVDFIQVWGFPAIFNIADIAVVTGMGLFLLLTMRGVGLDGTRHAKAAGGRRGSGGRRRSLSPCRPSNGAACRSPTGSPASAPMRRSRGCSDSRAPSRPRSSRPAG